MTNPRPDDVDAMFEILWPVFGFGDIDPPAHGTNDRAEFTQAIRAAILAYETSKRSREEVKPVGYQEWFD